MAETAGLSRRTVLEGGAVAVGASVLGPPHLARAAPVAAASLSGQAVARAAMHVHASYSEEAASWEQQYANARAQGLDVLWQTDHDVRARARGYMTRLSGTWLPSTTGSWLQHAASFSAAGPIRVMVEAAGSTAATQSLVMAERPTARNSFRTGIQGQVYTVAVGTARVDAGARFEIVLRLSLHPAQDGRPASTPCGTASSSGRLPRAPRKGRDWSASSWPPCRLPGRSCGWTRGRRPRDLADDARHRPRELGPLLRRDQPAPRRRDRRGPALGHRGAAPARRRGGPRGAGGRAPAVLRPRRGAGAGVGGGQPPRRVRGPLQRPRGTRGS